MKHWVKRTLSALLCLSVLLSTVVYAVEGDPASAAPAPSAASDFTVKNGVITEYTGSDALVVIPAAIDGVTITAIGDEVFAWNTDMTGVVIPSTVETIGADAFASCYSLESFYFYGAPGSIDDYAIGYEYGTEDTLDDYVTITLYCKPNEEAKITKYNKDSYLYATVSPTITQDLADPSYAPVEKPEQQEPADGSQSDMFSYEVREDGAYIIGYNEKGTGGAITLPSVCTVDGTEYDVVGVAEKAFDAGNGSISGVKDSTALSKITKITIPASITKIEDFAFNRVGKYKDYHLKEVVFEGDDCQLGRYAFANNPKLATVSLPTALEKLPEGAFKGSALSEITLPATLNLLGGIAFQGCTELKTVHFDGVTPPAVTSYHPAYASGEPQWAFAGCTSLTVEVPAAAMTAYQTAWADMLKASNADKGEITLVGWGEGAPQVLDIPDFQVAVNENGGYMEYHVLNFDVANKTGDVELKYVGYNVGYDGGELVIPATVAHQVAGSQWSFTVKGIGAHAIDQFRTENSSSFYRFTSVEFPETLTYIAKGGCWGLEKVTELDLSNTSVETIGTYAFYGCRSAQTIKLPGALRQLGTETTTLNPDKGEQGSTVTYTENVFNTCDALTNIYVDEKNPNFKDVDGVLFTKDGKKLIRYPMARAAEHYDIPAGTEVIAVQAFSQSYLGNSSLHTVFFPDSVKEIQQLAFRQSSLTSVTLPANATFGSCAFDICKELTTVTIPEGVTALSDSMFWHCEKLSQISFPDSLKKVGKSCFELSGLTSVSLNQVEELGDYAFYNCDGLTSVDLPATAQTLGTGVFASCAGLKRFAMAEGCKTVSRFLLANDRILEELILPDTVKTIGEFAFSGCHGLTKMTMPKSLAEMGGYVFNNCLVASVIFPDEAPLTALPEGTFQNCIQLAEVYLGKNIASTGAVAFFTSDRSCTMKVNCGAAQIERNEFDVYPLDLANDPMIFEYNKTNDTDANGYPVYMALVKPDPMMFPNPTREQCKPTPIYATFYPPEFFMNCDAPDEQDKDKPVNPKPVNPRPSEPQKPDTTVPILPETAPHEAFPFRDVPSDAFYAEPVLWAVENKITDGVAESRFAPMVNCTRSQIVTFLWRAAGCPSPKGSTAAFSDVTAGSYYESAVLWATENGITNGISIDTFGSDGQCTRAQAVTFLWRAAGCPSPKGSTAAFSDVTAGSYYESAVLWATENGITCGTGAAAFSPDSVCTRAEIVTFLYRSSRA